MTYSIRFLPGIQRDAPLLSRTQDRLAQKFLCKAREVDDPTHVPFEDVVPCEPPLLGWYRYKPSVEMRQNCDCDIRIVFRVHGNEIIVLAVGSRTRDQVYRDAANRVRAAYQTWNP